MMSPRPKNVSRMANMAPTRSGNSRATMENAAVRKLPDKTM